MGKCIPESGKSFLFQGSGVRGQGSGIREKRIEHGAWSMGSKTWNRETKDFLCCWLSAACLSRACRGAACSVFYSCCFSKVFILGKTLEIADK
jgi:hypothetical protein